MGPCRASLGHGSQATVRPRRRGVSVSVASVVSVVLVAPERRHKIGWNRTDEGAKMARVDEIVDGIYRIWLIVTGWSSTDAERRILER
jgi:hypothetical protein